MDPTVSLLIGLLLGAVLGAALTVLLLRRRPETPSAAQPRASEELLDLADERFARDAARRDAAEAAREAELQRTLSPIVESLSQLERAMHRTEHARVQADGALQQHLQDLARRAHELDQGTSALTAALRAPTSRGRWGEVQLRRIVEAAGMVEHVDFSEQLAGQRVSGDAAQRPDLVVHLAGDRHVVIDAKAPMDAYLDAVEETDQRRARTRRQAHAKALRHHVDRLGQKAYWAGLGDTPEFTVLFVPSDGVLAAALESDPGLLEHAFSQEVVVASPATLVALLRTVAHTWRTDALNRDARAVLDTGRELHHRLGTMTSHLAKLGRSLDGAVASFNETVGSLQSRVMVTARRFEEMELTAGRIEDVDQLTRRSRALDEAEIAELARGRSAGDGETGRRGARDDRRGRAAG